MACRVWRQWCCEDGCCTWFADKQKNHADDAFLKQQSDADFSFGGMQSEMCMWGVRLVSGPFEYREIQKKFSGNPYRQWCRILKSNSFRKRHIRGRKDKDFLLWSSCLLAKGLFGEKSWINMKGNSKRSNIGTIYPERDDITDQSYQ